MFHLPVFSCKQYTLSRTSCSIIDINFQSSNLSQIYTRSKGNLISASPFNVIFFHHFLNISILLLIIQFKLNCRIFRNNIVHLVEFLRFHDELAISTASFCPCTDNSTTLVFILDRTIKVIGYREVIYRNLEQFVYEAVVNTIRCVHSVSHFLGSSPTRIIRRSSSQQGHILELYKVSTRCQNQEQRVFVSIVSTVLIIQDSFIFNRFKIFSQVCNFCRNISR